MKISLIGILVIVCSGIAAEYPAQQLSSLHSVRFGQHQSEIESAVKRKASPNNLPNERAGKDYVLEVHGAKLQFDSGKLSGIRFEENFDFRLVVAPFAEAWKNLDPIDGLRVKPGIAKAEFLKYLKAWEDRAKKWGASRNDGNRLLTEGEYRLRSIEEELSDMIYISFGPQRSTGKGGGSWGSGCSVTFVTQQISSLYRRKAGTLLSISVFCDVFNTRRRTPSEIKDMTDSKEASPPQNPLLRTLPNKG